MRIQGNRRVQAQALAEMVIALVGMVTLLLGLALVARAGHESLANLLRARTSAEQQMDGTTLVLSNYVHNWTPGADAMRFTRDDEADATGGSATLYRDLLDQPVPLSWLETSPTFGLVTAITPLLSGPNLTLAADLRAGSADVAVPVDPGLRPLIGSQLRELALRDRVVMPGIAIGQNAPSIP